MKFVASCILAVVALLLSVAAMGQCTLFAGTITGEDGQPLKGAIIQLKWKKDLIEARTDERGLFYTTLVPLGMYKVLVVADGKVYTLRRVKILPRDAKTSYNFSIHGERLFLTIEGEDPFFKSEITRVEQQDWRNTILWGSNGPQRGLKIHSLKYAEDSTAK
jgi:hypothetical protein